MTLLSFNLSSVNHEEQRGEVTSKQKPHLPFFSKEQPRLQMDHAEDYQEQPTIASDSCQEQNNLIGPISLKWMIAYEKFLVIRHDLTLKRMLPKVSPISAHIATMLTRIPDRMCDHWPISGSR